MCKKIKKFGGYEFLKEAMNEVEVNDFKFI